MNARQVRRFNLERDIDVSGVSGTGAVAFGVQAPNGTCVLWWDSEHESVGIYPSMDTLLAIHGHSGSTRAVFIDEPATSHQVPPARSVPASRTAVSRPAASRTTANRAATPLATGTRAATTRAAGSRATANLATASRATVTTRGTGRAVTASEATPAAN